jgi:hypothetical protein
MKTEQKEERAETVKEDVQVITSLKRSNYFVRHWRGELSLGISYWLNGLLATFLVLLAANTLVATQNNISLTLLAVLSLLVYATAIVASVWQLVGVWRSASNHVLRGGKSGWAALAKVAVIVGVLNCVVLFCRTYIPQSVEMVSIIAGDKGMPPYEIRILPGGKDVEFRGGIRAGSAKELERILNAVPQAKVLHVNSVGGRIHEAENMAKLVRERGLVTYTSEECLSAATLVFLSGKERVVEARAKLGFHRPTFPGMTDEQRRDCDKSTRQTMRTAGVSDEFINQVLATAPENMWYPSIDEMQRAGVITSESFGDRFAASGALLRGSSSSDVDKAFRDLPGFSAIKEIEPTTYQKMVSDFSAAIQSGKSVAEAQQTVRLTADKLMLKYRPMASDQALRAMRDLWVEMLVRFKDRDSRACIAVFSPKSAPPDFSWGRVFYEWSSTNNLIVIDQVLRSAAEGTPPQLDAVQAGKDLTSVQSKLRRKYGDGLAVLANDNEWMQHSEQVCEMLLCFYQETQNIPGQRQGNLLRFLLSNENLGESASEEFTAADFDPPSDYIVSRGDSFSAIAKKFGVSLKALEAANPNVQPTQLKIGQNMHIPSVAPTRASTGQTPTVYFGSREGYRGPPQEEPSQFYARHPSAP